MSLDSTRSMSGLLPPRQWAGDLPDRPCGYRGAQTTRQPDPLPWRPSPDSSLSWTSHTRQARERHQVYRLRRSPGDRREPCSKGLPWFIGHDLGSAVQASTLYRNRSVQQHSIGKEATGSFVGIALFAPRFAGEQTRSTRPAMRALTACTVRARIHRPPCGVENRITGAFACVCRPGRSPPGTVVHRMQGAADR